MTTPTSPPADDPGQVAELNESVLGLRQDVRDLRATQDENTRAQRVTADELRTKQTKSDRALKAARRTGVALVILVVLLLGLKWRDDRQKDEARDDAAVTSCLNANESRKAIVSMFEQLIAQLGSLNTPSDPVAAELRRQAIASFNAEFVANVPPAMRPRDCSERAATSPTLVPTTTGPG